MPVVDPNYENFSYQGLLDRATQPLQTLGQGQLAIAQQENQRRFQLMAAQRESDMAQQRELARMGAEQRNRIAEIGASEQSREREQQATVALNQREARKQAVATAQQINPDFKDNPNDSDEAATAKANAVQHQKTLQAFKDTVDSRDKALSDYNALIDKMGLPKTIDQNRLNALVAQDPIFVNRLSPEQKSALQNGTISIDQLIDSLRSGKISATLTALNPLGGVNPRDLASDLATKAQTVRQNLQQEQQQIIGAKLGASGQQLQSRFNTQNEMASKLMTALPAYMFGDAMKYSTQNGGPVPSAASQTNPDGTLKILNPGTTAPAGSPTAASGLPPSMSATPAPPAGTPPISDFRYLVHRKGYQDTTDKLHDLNAEKSQMDQDFQAGGQTLPPAASGLSASYGHPIGPSFVPFDQDTGAMAAKRYSGIIKQIEQVSKERDTHYNALRDIAQKSKQFQPATPVQPPAPAPTPNPMPPAPQPAGGYGVPGLFGPMPGSNTPQTNAPSAMNTPNGQTDPMAYRAAQNRIQQLLGTGDPQVLQAAKQRGQQMGIDVNALIQGVAQNDPHAIATARGLVQDVTGGNNGQIIKTVESI